MKQVVVRGSDSHGVEWTYRRVLGALKLAGIDAEVTLEKEKTSGLGTAGTPRLFVDGKIASLEDFEMEARLARMFDAMELRG